MYLYLENKKKTPDTATKKYQSFAVHTVRPSHWPFSTALTLGTLLLSSVSYFHFCTHGLIAILISLVLFLYNLYLWFYDVIYESYEGQHTLLVQFALKAAFILFMISEMMFFVSFFWSFFHFSLSPSVFIFCIWPPMGIDVINAWEMPFLNTVYLLSSGIFLTSSHSFIILQKKFIYFLNKVKKVKHFLGWTMMFGSIFTCFQVYEYINSNFSMNDSVYGSVFFMATGFHGLHVLVGTVFLIVTLGSYQTFSPQRHLNFECAAYYWHFVDVVWMFLFISMYWWGGA